MREPKSVALRCGRWYFLVGNGHWPAEMMFELRWRSRGGELQVIARRIVSEQQIVFARFDIVETVWDELEKHALAQLEG